MAESQYRVNSVRTEQGNHVKEKKGGITVARYRESRFWGVWDERGELVCVCVYRKGAREVAHRLADSTVATR